jgi:hypothetical protein
MSWTTIFKIGAVVGAIYMFVRLRGGDAAEKVKEAID